MRSFAERVGRYSLPTFLYLAVLAVSPALALDIFTLWRQPMIPMQMTVGAWIDYRTVTWVRGQRSEDLVRIQCVGRSGQDQRGDWKIEMLPLVETEAGLTPIAGEGLELELSVLLLQRKGELTDLVTKVVRWADEVPTTLTSDQWREDPLVSSSLASEFEPQSSEVAGSTSRVVAGRELMCDQFTMAASDTESVELPRGLLHQIVSWEVTAAVNNEVPFLGIVYATERTQSHSRLEPPSERFALPPPVTEVGSMELVGYGNGARSAFQSR